MHFDFLWHRGFLMNAPLILIIYYSVLGAFICGSQNLLFPVLRSGIFMWFDVLAYVLASSTPLED